MANRLPPVEGPKNSSTILHLQSVIGVCVFLRGMDFDVVVGREAFIQCTTKWLWKPMGVRVIARTEARLTS